MMKLLPTLLLATTWFMMPNAARAQAIPQWMRVRGAYLSGQGSPEAAESHASTMRPAIDEHPAGGSLIAAQFRQTRARRILASGLGLVLSAAATTSYVLPNREPCFGSDSRKGGAPLKGAIGVAALGVASIVGGATWLRHERIHYAKPGPREHRLVDAGIGALAFLLGQAVLGPVFFVDQMCNT